MKKFLLTILLLGGFGFAYSQGQITGTVSSADDGSEIPGVSVRVKGSNTGTQTDVNGKYSVSAAKGAVLQFSFIGFMLQEVTVANESVINVAMKVDSKTLQELVATGLGRVKEEKAVGTAMQTISNEKLTFVKETNVASALSGKIAGVKLQGAPSTSFREPNLQIRGASGLSIYGSPLYVLDGTPVELNAVNMDNVESISVLKGAAATAIYGQRASEGVVVLTTKRAKKGKIQVDLNSATTFSNVYNLPPYQNEYAGGYSQEIPTFEYNPAIHPAEWASFNGQNTLEYYADESWGPKMDGRQYRPYYSWFPSSPEFGKQTALNPQPNNVKDFFQTGVDLNNNITLSGGSENGTMRLSYTNIDRSLPIPNTKLKRNFVTVNSTYKLGKKIEVGANLNYMSEKQQGRPLEGYGQGLSGSFNQWFQRQIDMDILSNYKNPNGTFNSWNINGPEDTKPLYWDNPYYDVNENIYKHNQDRIYGDVNLKYNITKKLSVQGWVRNSSKFFDNSFNVATGGLNLDGFYTSDLKTVENNYEFMSTYNDRFGDITMDLNFGGNIRNQTALSTSQSTVGGLSIPAFYQISASKDAPSIAYRKSEKIVRSLYGIASFGYKGLLFLDATLRNDWSSTLPVENNSYLYPSIASSFVFSEFMKDQSVLSFGKLKASWASIGSDTDPYGIYPVYNAGPQGSYTVMNLPSQLPNVNLKPTLSTSYDLGFELRFLKDKIGIDFTYYNRLNTDQILPLSVPSSSGYSTALVNAGKIQNKGIEIAMTFNPIKTENFNWDINFNVAKATSIVKELAEGLDNYQLPTFATYGIGTQVAGSSTAFGPTVNAKVGEPFGTLIGRGFRIDPTTGQRVVGANGKYLYDDNVNLGSILPDFTGGFINMLSYKNIKMNFNIDFQKGGKVYSVTRMFNAYSGLGAETVGLNAKGNPMRDAVADGGGLLAEGVLADGTPNTQYIEADTYWKSFFRLHERWLYDASYAKLREVSIGYTLPKSLYENVLPFRSIYVGAVGSNVLILRQPVKGLDPSELESIWSEGGQLPAARSFGFNIKLGL
ncbi:SusC/RagA family TonB-linked outer membrane protein [Lacihabitans lacunae]|jgi:TonB-linked SusC/RagA family outer membrane protein|uniref:SusC/RagA family TonB-linked outer membrane protein n=1 Tax=Lacihabitans lacunae TaxID=1028214 RepID=A0ABV7Z1D7_9BACT